MHDGRVKDIFSSYGLIVVVICSLCHVTDMM